jgi:hypothetical protein
LMPGLVLYQPDTTVAASFVGRGGVTTDGLGQLATGGTLQAEVPAGSSVAFALLYAATVGGGDTTTIRFAGSDVTLAPLPNVRNSSMFSTTRANVTSIVRGIVGSGGSVFDFAVGSDPTTPLLNGVALVVVYANRKQPMRSVSVFDGGLDFGPDTTTLSFGRTFRRVPTSFQATLALGIQHGYQGDDSSGQGTHACGTGSDQYSIVDINGSRLTSCAGNYDDGYGQDGALMTVGGVGDSLDLPSDPYQTPGDGTTPRTTDDELYNISKFVRDGDSSLSMTTTNPSNDDSIFLAVLTVTGETTAVGSKLPLAWPFLEPPTFDKTRAAWHVECKASPSTSCTSTHVGDDWYAQDWNWGGGGQDLGKVIVSPANGTVLFAGAGDDHLYGNQVVIQVGTQDSAVRFAHLDSVLVQAGDTVCVGTPVGLLGGTPTDIPHPYTPHLHAAVYSNLSSQTTAGVTGFSRLATGSDVERLSGEATIFARDFEFNGLETGGGCGAGAPLAIQGRVANARGAGLGDVPVALIGNAAMSATLTYEEGSGHFAFTAVPGTYQVSAARAGCTFSPASQTVTLTDHNFVLPDFVAVGRCP